jgi:hypothetical protein
MKIMKKIVWQHLAFATICFASLTVTGCGGSSDANTQMIPPLAPPDSTAVLQTGVYDSTVVEGAGDLEFVVSLSSLSSETVRVD